MSKDAQAESLITQFRRDGTVDSNTLHPLCRSIDIKKALPFADDKAAEFLAVLLAAHAQAGAVQQAKYVNTMLHVRSCAPLDGAQSQQVQAALDKVCAC